MVRGESRARTQLPIPSTPFHPGAPTGGGKWVPPGVTALAVGRIRQLLSLSPPPIYWSQRAPFLLSQPYISTPPSITCGTNTCDPFRRGWRWLTPPPRLEGALGLMGDKVNPGAQNELLGCGHLPQHPRRPRHNDGGLLGHLASRPRTADTRSLVNE